MASRAGVVRQGHDLRNPPPPSGPLGDVYRNVMVAQELPATPEIALAIMAIVDREDVAVADLAALVPRDPALATRLLALSNGLYFGAARKITDVRQAVTMLGLARVRELVTTLSVRAMLNLREAHSGMRDTWRHSLLVAGAAKMIGNGMRLGGEEAFIAGVLHDIGKVVLGLRFKDAYWDVVQAAGGDGPPLEAREVAIWGAHHGTVGRWLLQLWGLSATITEPAGRHHDDLVASSEPSISGVVTVANRLVRATDPEQGIPDDVFESCRGLIPAWLTRPLWERAFGDLVANNDELVMLCDGEPEP